MTFQPYDPTWLVELAKKQFPDEEWLHQALQESTNAEVVPDDPDYTVVFIDRMIGKFWQNVVLIDPKVGRIVLDILVDKRVAGFSIIGMPFEE